MKTFIKFLAVVYFVVFTGCKGVDLTFGLNPFHKPIGSVRITQVPDQTEVAKNTDVEVHMSLKRQGGTIGSEDVEINVRMPGTRTAENAQKVSEPKKDLLPIPQLLTSAK